MGWVWSRCVGSEVNLALWKGVVKMVVQNWSANKNSIICFKLIIFGVGRSMWVRFFDP